MRPVLLWMAVLVGTLALSACAVISRQVRSQAYPPIAFEDLLQNPDAYLGKTVILGGYVIKTCNQGGGTLIFVLQSPLGLGEEPGSRDASRGRFIVSAKGFLDPEVYSKDRRITVAGKVAGSRVEPEAQMRYRYPVLQSIEIHLWPKYESSAPYPYYYGPWFYGHYYWGLHYHHYPYGFSYGRYYRR